MADLKSDDITKEQSNTYGTVKAATDAIGKVPFVGKPMLDLAQSICVQADTAAATLNRLAGLQSPPDFACQAVKDSVGDLHAPAFPTTDRASAKTSER